MYNKYEAKLIFWHIARENRTFANYFEHLTNLASKTKYRVDQNNELHIHLFIGGWLHFKVWLPKELPCTTLPIKLDPGIGGGRLMTINLHDVIHVKYLMKEIEKYLSEVQG